MSDFAWPWRGAPPRDAEVRRRLLPLTLEHARKAPWYRKAWGSRWRRGLEALPLLTKELAVEHADQLLAVSPGAFVGVVSSGTQHGDREPLRVPELEGEREAFAQFVRPAPVHPERSRGALHLATVHPERSRGALHLEVMSMQHGFPEGDAPDGTLRVPWTFTASTFRLLQTLLLEPQQGGRRVESLLIGAAALVPLTVWLYEHDVDFSKLRVTDIGTTGFRLGPHWRARVEALWGARVHDNFSLSELAVPAPGCDACGHHHFEVPAVVAEVLDPVTHRPLKRGVGVLVVTSLWPFVQAMPLIRYWTGDLVALGPRCAERGERGFIFRGRLAQCAMRGRDLLLSPQDVEAFLDGRPEVARLPHPAAQLGLVKSPDVGVPRFEMQQEKGKVTVRVELRFDPGVFPVQAASLASDLAKSLRLGRRLVVELTRPNTLTRTWSKF